MRTETEIEFRELDAWIAEHVIGLKLNANGMIETWRRPGHRHDLTVRNYSTEIPDALTVLDKCRELVKAKSDGEHQYSVRIDCDYPFTIYQLESKFMECRFRVEDESLQIAICLFAKKLFS